MAIILFEGMDVYNYMPHMVPRYFQTPSADLFT